LHAAEAVGERLGVAALRVELVLALARLLLVAAAVAVVGGDGEAARDEVVAPVARLDLDGLAGEAEVLEVLLQDDFHGVVRCAWSGVRWGRGTASDPQRTTDHEPRTT